MQSAGGERLLTTKQYAEKTGYPIMTVQTWCKTGNLPGVEKVPTARNKAVGWYYAIPENAEPIKRQTHQKKEQKEPERIQRLKTFREKVMHIRKYAVTRTYKRLCAETGLTHEEVRQIYDRLHARYGI